MRRDQKACEAFAERHGAAQGSPIKAYSTISDFLADKAMTAVYVATPPHLHCENVLACLDAGVKRILVEKPMARTVSECETMLAACAAAGAVLHVAFYRRGYEKFRRVKQILDAGGIGTVLGARLQMCASSAQTGWRVDPTVSGGGHFMDVGSHRLDMLAFLLGDAVHACGYATNEVGHHAGENDVVLSLQTARGILVSGSFHYFTSPQRDVLEIFGSKGSIILDPFDGDSVREAVAGEAVREHKIPNPSPVHLPYVQALVDYYAGKGDAAAAAGVLVTGDDGLATSRVMEAVKTGTPF